MNATEAISIALRVDCMCRPQGVISARGNRPWHGEALEVSDTCFWRVSVFNPDIDVDRQVYSLTPEDLMYPWEVVGIQTLRDEERQERESW